MKTRLQKMERSNHLFIVGGHGLSITFVDTTTNDMSLLPSFAPFAVAELSGKPLISLTVDDCLAPATDKKLIRDFDTGNGFTEVSLLPDGGYEYSVKDLSGNVCCLLSTNADFSCCTCALYGNHNMRSFGLNDALMLLYAFAGSFAGTLLIHASCIVYDGKAYPFVAKSGTGKSTHTSMWLRYIEGTELINDDNPIIRIIDGEPLPRLYGSPWSGKTPCYRNMSAPLGAITRIERAPKNSIKRESLIEAFASLLPCCSSMKWDRQLNDNLCNTLSRLLGTTPVYTLYCLPDEEAARLSHSTLTKA